MFFYYHYLFPVYPTAHICAFSIPNTTTISNGYALPCNILIIAEVLKDKVGHLIGKEREQRADECHHSLFIWSIEKESDDARR